MSDTKFPTPEIDTEPVPRSDGRKNRAAKKSAASINHLLEFILYKDLPEYCLQQQQQYSNNRNGGHRVTNNQRNLNKLRNSSYNSNYHQRRQFTHSNDTYNNSRVRAPRKKPKSYLHGMRFINVNYKFVVDYRKDYAAQRLDPNVPVDTNDIICIVVPEGNACPICLSAELVAPRMITSCGHILCLPCLLALLDSEVPTSMKRESKAVVEKYTDCPLCASVIRRGDVKPVLLDTTDVRFDMPKVNDEVVLTLMARDLNRIVPVPSYAYNSVENAKGKRNLSGSDQFPWADQLHTDPYLRIYKGDHTYLAAMYESEKKALRNAYENDSDLFLPGRKLLRMALLSIDNDVCSWTEKFNAETKSAVSSSYSKVVTAETKSTLYYFQTGFKCAATYVLSALDMKVLKSSYGDDYLMLPPSIVAKVENIRYEEMDEELATTKYKYISHLPLGTQIGFLECCWENNELVNPQVWATFKLDLVKRSKISSRIILQEERNRQRAINEEERRAREYIDRENKCSSLGSNDWMRTTGIGGLTITDEREMPALTGDSLPEDSQSSSADALIETQRSVWGTQIPIPEMFEEPPDNGWDADEMIRQAREEIEKQELSGKGQKGKRKKRYVLLLSNGWS